MIAVLHQRVRLTTDPDGLKRERKTEIETEKERRGDGEREGEQSTSVLMALMQTALMCLCS